MQKEILNGNEMTILLNGEELNFSDSDSVSINTFLQQKSFDVTKVAVAVNGDFVPRSQYADVLIKNQDQIEVLSAVQGG